MRFRAYIAIPALSAALALVGLAGPVAAQARTVPIAQSGQGATSSPTFYASGYQVYCYSPGAEYTVNADNIHIRSTPDGAIAYSIAKGAHFDSNWYESNCGGISGHFLLVTVEQYGGQQWVHGWAHANSSHVGWVGGAYLWWYKNCNNNGC